MFNVALFRWYQLKAINALWEYFTTMKGHPIIAMPTASGKSWVIAGFIRLALMFFPHCRIVMVTHDSTLVRQNLAKLLTIWPNAPVGVYCEDLKRKEFGMSIVFATIQSIANMPELCGHVDLVVIDEAHLVSPKQETRYQIFFWHLWQKNPLMKIVGLTATPYRLGLGTLLDGGTFTDICYDLTTVENYNRLVAEGWLSPLIARETDYRMQISENTRIRGGEYVEKDLDEQVNKKEVTQKVLNEMCRIAEYRNRWLIFATSVDHCNQINEMLNGLGVSCLPVHSKLKGKLSDEHQEAFTRGEVRACVSMNALITGVDIPEIDFIGVMRYTNSPAWWVQMLGRGGRVAPWANKTNCLVGDFTTNSYRLGPINDPKLPRKPGKGGGGDAPIRVCPQCKFMNHPSKRHCGGFPYPTLEGCGYEFPPAIKFTPQVAGVEVQKGLGPAEGPQVMIYDVTHLTYQKHIKAPRRGGSIVAHPPSMKVEYFGGLQRVGREFVCFEHERNQPARLRAERWWLERAGRDESGQQFPVPDTVDQAMQYRGSLRTPAKIRVWMKEPYPEILSYVYGS
jgi:DNA repair protein RadD